MTDELYIRWISLNPRTGLVEFEFNTGHVVCFDSSELARIIHKHTVIFEKRKS